MATSAPPPKAPSGWTVAQSAEGAGGKTNGIEVGMSGMSLVSNLSAVSRPPGLSGSSLSDEASPRTHSFAPFNTENSEHAGGSFRGTPPSPSSPLGQAWASSQGNAKLPGIGLSFPSPIGRSSPRNHNTASSPLLTLTPSSSLDGNVEIFGGRQSSPFYEGSSSIPPPPNLDQSGESSRNSYRENSAQWGDLPFASSPKDNRRDPSAERRDFVPVNAADNNESLSSSFGAGGLFSTGSFDPTDQHDGLRGLGALRDRAHTAPGPFPSLAGNSSGSITSSPRSYRDLSPGRGDGLPSDSRHSTGSRHSRTNSRDGKVKMSSRPPLSGGGSSTNISQYQDGQGSNYLNNQGVMTMQQSQQPYGSTKSKDANIPPGYGQESFQNQGYPPPPQLKGRSMSLGTTSSFGENRELPAGNLRNSYIEAYQHQLQTEQSHAQKFGSFQTLNSHLQQQRLPVHSHHQMQHPQLLQLEAQQQGRHVRSFSQPGPLQNAGLPASVHSHEDFSRFGLSQLQLGSENPLDYGGGQQQRFRLDNDNAILDEARYGRSLQGQQLPRSISAGANLPQSGVSGLIPRNGSLSHPSLSSSAFEGRSLQGNPAVQGHISQNNMNGGPMIYSGQHVSSMQQGAQRRDSCDLQGGRSPRYDDSGGQPVMATPQEMMMHGGVGGYEGDRRGTSGFGQERRVSPSQIPHHVSVGGRPGGHVRHFSDGGAMAATTVGVRGGIAVHPGQNPSAHLSHQGQSSVMMPGVHQRSSSFDVVSGGHHRRSPSFDDDLAHPLVGEHIDDPGDDVVVSTPATYGTRDGVSPHPPIQTSQQGLRSTSSLEQMPPVALVSHYAAVESVQHHRAPGSSASPGPRVVYNVKFKRTQRNFIPGPRITRDLKIGCYVKVEADRGEDLGIVVSNVAAEKFNASGRSSFRASPGSSGTNSNELTAGAIPPPGGVGAAGAADLKRIIRLATHDEVSLLAVKREEEEELLKICRGKVRQRALPMHVVDAEYQFDRHKLTFFFEAEGRIDFRELVRDLFSMYKTRIWMQQLDKNGSGSAGPTGGDDGSSPSSAHPHYNEDSEPAASGS